MAHPGNLRELRNAIERAVILARQEQICPEDFPAELRAQDAAATVGDARLPLAGSLISLEKLEEAHLRKILEQISSLTEASEIPGIDQAARYRKRKRNGLN